MTEEKRIENETRFVVIVPDASMLLAPLRLECHYGLIVAKE